ncbi:site-specific DNA-methyltransferase [bacterium]|nr:site-specific DNA-methyltransferase [bacterium]
MSEPTADARATTASEAAPGGRKHRRNTLNDLTGRDWIKFTKSWFICDSRRYLKNKATELHPARYPEEMVSEFIQFFTKPGEWVLDPFCGSGATLVACQETGRHGVGIELSAEYAQVARRRLLSLDCETEWHVLEGDSRDVSSLLGSAGFQPAKGQETSDSGRAGSPHYAEAIGELDTPPGLPASPLPHQYDFIITSPPYFDMLRKSRGGVDSAAKKRARAGLGTHYGDDRRDLGNITSYEDFVEALGLIFDDMHDLLRPGRYLVAVIQNLRDTDGEVRPLAWDLARRLSQRFSFQGERVWCQNSKPLGIWGYPTVFVPNVHHHYCLIFRVRPDAFAGGREHR